MKVSPFCKRFKHSHIMGDTFTLPRGRSSIICNLQKWFHYQNTPNLRRLGKQTQIKEIETQKTDRILSVYDRALFVLPYADTVIITGHVSRPSVSTSHGQVNTKPKTYLIIEMIPFLVYYSYERKYHNRASMNIPGYRCSNVYINVEKGASMYKYIQ